MSTVTEVTSKILTLKNSDPVLSCADGFPLSVLGKSEILLENKLKFAKITVCVIKELQCNSLGLSKSRKLGLLAVENNVCKIEDVSTPSSATTDELTTACKDFSSAPASSVIATIVLLWLIVEISTDINFNVYLFQRKLKKLKMGKDLMILAATLWHLV